MPTWFFAFVLVLLAVMAMRLVWFIVAARRYHRDAAWAPRPRAGGSGGERPTVSVIVPAYNESLGIAHCLRGMATQTYPVLEVIVVDDGSTDDTFAVASSIADEPGMAALRVIAKPNGGKADALNYGILHASGEIVVTVDADSVLEPDAIERLVEAFADPSVGAVGGNVRVAAPKGFLGHHQMVEYIGGLMLQRSAFASIDSMQVISGAIGAFRREVLQEVGGYSSDTVTEDFDITLAVWKAGYRVTFHPRAIAWTEGPSRYRDLLSQRIRWTFGGFQTLRKYRRDATWSDGATWTDTSHWSQRTRRIARVGLPYFIVGPWFDVLVSVAFFATLGLVIASGSWTGFLLFYGGTAMVSAAVAVYALHLDRAPRWWAIFAVTMTLWYSHFLAFATLVAGIRRLTGHQGSWRKLERRGHNVLPETAHRATESPVAVG